MLDALKSFFDAVMIGDEQAIKVLAALYFLIAFSISLIISLRIRAWPMATGTLMQNGLDKWGNSLRADEQNYTAEVRYKYAVAGQEYEGHRLSPALIMVTSNLRFILKRQMSGITNLGGDEVAVFYNPAKPKKSFLIKPGRVVIGFLIAVIGISVISLIVVLK